MKQLMSQSHTTDNVYEGLYDLFWGCGSGVMVFFCDINELFISCSYCDNMPLLNEQLLNEQFLFL